MKKILLIPVLLLTLTYCKPSKVPSSLATLEDTYSRLVEMNGNPVMTPEGVKEAHFILSSAGNIKGFGGCNTLAGGYTHGESNIKFTVVSTKMMCADEQMEIETFFTKTLTSSDAYKIVGEVLDLYEGNTLLAKFQAVYLK